MKTRPARWRRRRQGKILQSKREFRLEAYYDANKLRIRSTCRHCALSVVGDSQTVERWASQHLCGGSHDQVRVSRNPYIELRAGSMVSELPTEVMDASASDFGNVQLFDSSQESLRLVAHRGFAREFVEYFAAVAKDQTACAAAMKRRARVIVFDVANDPIFRNSKSREVMLRAEARSVQSTPLFARSGTFLGMVSTHYRTVGHPLASELELIDQIIARYTQQLE